MSGEAIVIELQPSPWWASQPLVFARVLAVSAGNCMDLLGVSVTVAAERISFFARHDSDILIHAPESARTLAHGLRDELAGHSLQATLSIADDRSEEVPGTSLALMNDQALSDAFDTGDEVIEGLEKAGVYRLFDLASLPPVFLSKFSGVPEATIIRYVSLATFRLIPGIDRDLSSQLVERGFKCLVDFIKTDAESLSRALREDNAEAPSTEVLTLLQVQAKQVGMHLFTVMLAGLTSEQLCAILRRQGVESLSAKLSVLIKLFDDSTVADYWKAFERVLGEGVPHDRHRLTAAMSKLAERTLAIEDAQRRLSRRIAAFMPNGMKRNGVSVVPGIPGDALAKLEALGVDSLSDLRVLDPEEVAAKTGIPAERLRQWQRTADLVSLPGINPELSYAIVDLGLYEPALHAYQTQFGAQAARGWAWERPTKERDTFSGDSEGIGESLLGHAKKLHQSGVLTKGIPTNLNYLASVYHQVAHHEYFRVGIACEDARKHHLAKVIGAISCQIHFRMVPVPLPADYPELAARLCVPLVIELAEGDWRIELPEITEGEDIEADVREFFRYLTEIGEGIAMALGCQAIRLPFEQWENARKLGVRRLPVYLPKGADSEQMAKLVSALEFGFRQVFLSEDETLWVTGRVVDSEGEPIPGVRVEIEPRAVTFPHYHRWINERENPFTFTNSAGRYAFTLSCGIDDLWWSADGGVVVKLTVPGYVGNTLESLGSDLSKRHYELTHKLTPVTIEA